MCQSHAAHDTSLCTSGPVAASHPPRMLAPATPPELARLLEMHHGLPADEVGRRILVSGRLHETDGRSLAFYLLEMETRRLYQATGHSSTEHFVRVGLDLDRRRVAELLRVARKLLELPLLDRTFCERRISWAKVLIVARMAVPEHEASWVEKALALDIQELKRLAARSKPGQAPRADGNEKGLPEVRYRVEAIVGAVTFTKLEQAQRKVAAELGRDVTVAELLDVLATDLLTTEADGTVPGRKRVAASHYRVELHEGKERGDPLTVDTEDGPLPVDAGGPGAGSALSEAIRCDAGVRNHHAHDHRAKDVKTPSDMRDRVLRRDRYRCRSCCSKKVLMVHHMEFRSHGGRTHPKNLITLCMRCHALVHANLLVLEGPSVDQVRFLDAEGWPVDVPRLVGLEGLLKIKPPEPLPKDAATAVEPDVTLPRVPHAVDATWWRRHAHLVKDRGERGQLAFVAGRPVEPEAVDPLPIAAASEAFAGVVGQTQRIANLRHEARVARSCQRLFPDVLLTGPAGTGKTTLAQGIAALAQQPLLTVTAPLLSDRTELVRLLAGLEPNTVLFLDEAQELPPALQDVLLQAMSERRLSFVLSDGVKARGVTLRLPAFTLVAATTDESALSKALRSRFAIRERLVHLEEQELAEVVTAAATSRGVEATPEGALQLAKAARGTPREALRLLDKVVGDLDLAKVEGAEGGARVVTQEGVGRMLERLGYDADLLGEDERRYLDVLRGSRAPMPLYRLAASLGTTPKTVAECIEPWLFTRGFVRTTQQGREAVPQAWAHTQRLDVPAWNDSRCDDRVSDRGAPAFACAPNIRRAPPGARSSA